MICSITLFIYFFGKNQENPLGTPVDRPAKKEKRMILRSGIVFISFTFILREKKTNNEFLLHVSITKNTTCLGFRQSLLLPFSKGNAWL